MLDVKSCLSTNTEYRQHIRIYENNIILTYICVCVLCLPNINSTFSIKNVDLSSTIC